MSESFIELLSLSLPCDTTAPGQARHELDKLASIDPVRQAAMLIASELVSNAVLHSGCEEHDQIEVCARLADNLLEISVHDPGLSRSEPEVPAGRAIGGLGLAIIEKLAYRWGIHQPDGRRVWAQLLLIA